MPLGVSLRPVDSLITKPNLNRNGSICVSILFSGSPSSDDSVDIEESDDIDDNEDDVNDDSKKDLGQDEMVKKIMPKAQEVQKLLKSAHKNLVDAVKALKEDNRNPKAEVKTDNNGDDSTSSDENN